MFRHKLRRLIIRSYPIKSFALC